MGHLFLDFSGNDVRDQGTNVVPTSCGRLGVRKLTGSTVHHCDLLQRLCDFVFQIVRNLLPNLLDLSVLRKFRRLDFFLQF